MPRFWSFGVVLGLVSFSAGGHDLDGHGATTYVVGAADEEIGAGRHLRLTIVDGETGQPVAARFVVSLEGAPYVPAALNAHGIHFTSIHVGKKQRYVVLYARGTGGVEVPLPDSAEQGVVQIAKGLAYAPVCVPFTVVGDIAEARGELRQWSDVLERGWVAADEHLHYERLDPAHDGDWLTMLAADGLSQGHFMVLKGGNVSEVWAQQYAYGAAGGAREGGAVYPSGRRIPGQQPGAHQFAGAKRSHPAYHYR